MILMIFPLSFSRLLLKPPLLLLLVSLVVYAMGAESSLLSMVNAKASYVVALA